MAETNDTGTTMMPHYRRWATMSLKFEQFQLPPVRDALVIGRRAPAGSNGIARAMTEFSPGAFRLIKVDHPVIEGVLVRASDLRKVPEELLIPRLLKAAESIMDETDALHVTISIEITAETEQIELP